MSFSSSASQGSSMRQRTVREDRDESLLNNMICWLVSDGSKAMEESLSNHTVLAPRTDLGEQAVRMAELRQMLSVAYASRTTREKSWYSKLRRMKNKMREIVDKHLAQCSKHKRYRKLRERIDARRAESSESEDDLPEAKQREKINVTESSDAESETEANSPTKKREKRKTAKNSNSESEAEANSPTKKLEKTKTAKNSVSELETEVYSPTKKREKTKIAKNSDSESDAYSPTRKRKRNDDTENELSISKTNSSIKNRDSIDIVRIKLSGSEANLPLNEVNTNKTAMNGKSDSDKGSPVIKSEWINVAKIATLISNENLAAKRRRVTSEL